MLNVRWKNRFKNREIVQKLCIVIKVLKKMLENKLYLLKLRENNSIISKIIQNEKNKKIILKNL